MDYDWRRRQDFIEGEYEIIEERYVDNDSYIYSDPKPPHITYAILGINIAVWLIMSLVGLLFGWNINARLLYFGAKENSLIVRGQYWRLITAMFLHIDILHLFFNSYALYIYGPAVEKLFGKIKFLLIYLLSGLVGSILSYAFSPNPAAGASGAIFGLMGALLYFRKRKRRLFQRIFGPGLILIIGINLFYGFVQPGIDNWGHIGGLIGGYLVANAVGLYKDGRVRIEKLLAWLLLIAVILSGLWYGNYKYGRTVYLEYAYSALRNGNLEAAEAYINKAARGAYGDERVKTILQTVYIQKAENSLRNGDIEGALESINALIGYYPDDVNFLFIRAQIFERDQDHEKALEDYLKVAELEQNSAEVWFRTGRAAYNSGKIAEAKKYLQRALEIEPGFHKARKLLEQLNSMI